MVSVARVSNLWAAVLLVGLAAAAHAGFSANLYTIVSDTVPRKAVSFGRRHRRHGRLRGHAGVVHADRLHPRLDGTRLRRKGLLDPVRDCRLGYLVATGLIHLLLPRLEPMAVDETQGPASDTQGDN